MYVSESGKWLLPEEIYISHPTKHKHTHLQLPLSIIQPGLKLYRPSLFLNPLNPSSHPSLPTTPQHPTLTLPHYPAMTSNSSITYSSGAIGEVDLRLLHFNDVRYMQSYSPIALL